MVENTFKKLKDRLLKRRHWTWRIVSHTVWFLPVSLYFFTLEDSFKPLMAQIPDPETLVQLENNLRILLLAMGAASVALAGYMKKAFLSARDSEYLLLMIVPKSELQSLSMEHQSNLKAIGLMVHADSLAWALCTAPAIFGMGFLFMFGNPWDLVIFVGISYLGLAINRPQDLSISGRFMPS